MAARKSALDHLTPAQRVVAGALVLIIASIVMLARGCLEQPPLEPGQTLANRNIRFGMPAETKADPANKDAYLVEHPQFVLSYSDTNRTANWVCWNLNQTDIGNTERQKRFEQDQRLPMGFRRVKHEDYDSSGFDRGHICPSKDRSDTEDNNKATFLTTNIVPQSPASNQGGWERFEHFCRTLTQDGSELYIAAGPHGQGGTGRNGPMNTIGRTEPITVPAATWKVVMVLPNRDTAPTQTTRTLAVWIPNDMTVPKDWKPYAVSIAEVENRTGYKFFPLVPDDVAGPIKSRVDRGP